MANPPFNAPEQQSLLDRFRRELRNPSMMTVFLLIAAVLAIPLALLVPSWVETTRGSFQERQAADDLRDSTLISSSVQVPAQIAPWVLDQIEHMEDAGGPLTWHLTSFTEGPCNANNLSQLPAGPFADAIATSCVSLNQIQIDHADECLSVEACNFSSSVAERLDGVRVTLLDTFAEAGLVIPYTIRDEEPVGP